VLPADPNADPSDPPPTRGTTGQVVKIAPNGTKTVVAKGLPSYNAEGPTGPNGIVYAAGAIWIVTGGAGPGTPSVTPLQYEASVLRIDPATGAVTLIADIGAYERANNPDPYAVDTNPYGMTLGPDGNLYVADAGGNAIYQVNPTTKALKLLAVIPGVPYTPDEVPQGFPPANPARGGKPELDPVPTALAFGPDGNLYVTLLPGALAPQMAKVVKVTMSGQVSDVVTGLTTAVGIAFGPDKNMYVTQLLAGAPAGPNQPPTGNVVRITPDGQDSLAVEGLAFPNGIAFNKAGDLFITTGTAGGPPNVPPIGQIVRVDGVAKAAAPSPSPSAPPSPPPTGNGGNLPGLPSTGAGWGTASTGAFGGLALAVALSLGLLVVRRRRGARA
jgi:sugar lactone lactonase YvrE